MNILVNQHPSYNYLDSSICQGLLNLGHEVYSYKPGTNYVERCAVRTPMDLFIQFIRDGEPLQNCKSAMCWGEDDQCGIEKQFQKGFDAFFVRDLLPGQPGFPMNFGIEDRYYCATEHDYKPLKDREIDICFLGSLAGYKSHRKEYIERLKKDFSHFNLMLGPRQFNTPDDKWSKITLPYCAHDPEYFETLANSKICLSFKGAGPDCGRHYESMASGAICLIENMHTEMVADADVYWFENYDDLATTIDLILKGIRDDPEAAQIACDYAWRENRDLHSAKARAAYLLDKCGFSQ